MESTQLKSAASYLGLSLGYGLAAWLLWLTKPSYTAGLRDPGRMDLFWFSLYGLTFLYVGAVCISNRRWNARISQER